MNTKTSWAKAENVGGILRGPLVWVPHYSLGGTDPTASESRKNAKQTVQMVRTFCAALSKRLYQNKMQEEQSN
eukprot:706017-Amphidinium_carterae.2